MLLVMVKCSGRLPQQVRWALIKIYQSSIIPFGFIWNEFEFKSNDKPQIDSFYTMKWNKNG